MDTYIEIWGAGLAGLICANVLRKYRPQIIESKPFIPNNHKALLRFRTDRVSIATGIPFKKVKISKAVWDGKDLHSHSNIQLDNMYSLKATGAISSRSITDFKGEERYIAPGNFIERLCDGLDISLGIHIDKKSHTGNVISTLPMSANMKIAGLKDSQTTYDSKSISTVNCKILDPICDVYQTVYDVSSSSPFYRISISGNEVICEGRQREIESWSDTLVYGPTKDRIANMLNSVFGITQKTELTEPEFNTQKLGKILPIDEMARRRNIYHLTREASIFSLGRFATWRQIMLDDVANDISTIESLISQDEYDIKIYNSRKGQNK